MLIHYENYWTVDVDGKTSVEVVVAVVDVQVSSNAVAAAAAVAAFAVVVESFVGTYFDYFHKLYTLQRKTNKDSSNEREFDILQKVPTYRDFVAVVALLHEKLGFAAGSSAASSVDTREVQHHPRIPQEPRGRGGHKGCSTFEQKFLFIMILLLLSSTESIVRARQRCSAKMFRLPTQAETAVRKICGVVVTYLRHKMAKKIRNKFLKRQESQFNEVFFYRILPKYQTLNENDRIKDVFLTKSFIAKLSIFRKLNIIRTVNFAFTEIRVNRSFQKYVKTFEDECDG